MPRAKSEKVSVTPGEIEAPETPEIQDSLKVTTKWINLTKLKAKPVTIESRAYRPIHRYDESTHTNIPLTAQNMKDLIASTGGGFKITLKPATAGWAGWMDLQKLGVECVDFRCAVCGKREALNAVRLAEHFKVHQSQFTGRGVKGGEFFITLSEVKTPMLEFDEVEEDIDVYNLVED